MVEDRSQHHGSPRLYTAGEIHHFFRSETSDHWTGAGAPHGLSGIHVHGDVNVFGIYARHIDKLCLHAIQVVPRRCNTRDMLRLEDVRVLPANA
ncbi:MAG: hypothetical protein J6A79_06740 [Clostridia bacterium]|nr:hypothetical protein [Clostridia bacterium]